MFTPKLNQRVLPRLRIRRKGSERGQSLVEFAILLPVLMVFLLGILEFGWAMKSYVQEQNAAREGARYWALNGSTTCDKVRDAVETKGPGTMDWSIAPLETAPFASPVTGQTNCTSAAGTVVTVTAKYEYPFITPLGEFWTRVAGPMRMKASASMRVE
jgi:Flp pilus assembly protein TadG